MGIISERLQEIIESFDNANTSFDESEVYQKLNSLTSEKLEEVEEDKSLLMAESIAFGFIESYSDTRTGWGTYFGPRVVMPDEKGIWFESPSIRLVTSDMLAYWFGRAKYAKNATLKMRYADLVWDFTRPVTGKSPNIQAARIVIESSLKIVSEKKYTRENFAINKLRRGLSVALSISDDEATKHLVETIITFEDEISEDSKLGYWGFSFDLLISNKKVTLTDQQRKKIVDDLENRLLRFVQNTDYVFSLQAAENAAMRLVRYYQRIMANDDVKRVLKLFGQVVVSSAQSGNAMSSKASVEKLFDIYNHNGMKKEAEEISPLIEKLGKKSNEEMKTFSVPIEISREGIDQYFSYLLGDSLEEAFKRIAVTFIPNLEQTAELVRTLAKEAPLTYIFPIVLQDGDGRTLGQIGSLEEDFNGRVVYQLAQEIDIKSPFLNEIIKRCIDKYHPSTEIIIDYLYISPIFTKKNKTILINGVKAYLNGDYLTAAHLFIPQIESGLRDILQLSGGSVYKPGRNGGMFLKTLDDILREETIIKTFGDGAKYLQVLLTDQRGWNIRNNLCHGMIPYDMFGPVITNRLFHVLLVLALVREETN